MLGKLLTNNTQLTCNIFVLGGKNVGKTTLISEVQNFYNLTFTKQRLDEFGNDVFSFTNDKSNFVYNFFEVKNITLFKLLHQYLKNCLRNIVIFIYEFQNIEAEDFILQIKEILNNYWIQTEFHFMNKRDGSDDEIDNNNEFFSGNFIFNL